MSIPPFGVIEFNQIEDVKNEMILFLIQKSKYGKLASKTIKSYREWINPYLLFCFTESLSIEHEQSAKKYIQTLVDKERDLTYVNNVRLLLQKMFRHSLKELTNRDLSDEIRSDRELMFTVDKLNKIAFWCEDNIDQQFELCAYILLIYYTAARPMEVHSLTVGQVKELLAHNETKIIGKGHVSRYILTPSTPLHEKILQSICYRFVDDSSKIFTYHPRHLARKFQTLQKNVLLLPPPFPGPHALRRASGRQVYESSDIFFAMQRLGHKNPSTTHRYLRCNRDSVKTLISKSEEMRLVSRI
jgi:integrase